MRLYFQWLYRVLKENRNMNNDRNYSNHEKVVILISDLFLKLFEWIFINISEEEGIKCKVIIICIYCFNRICVMIYKKQKG